jgi:hypothetical protein
MALIAEDHPALSGDHGQYKLDEYNNSRILLYDLNKLINTLEKKEIQHYTINTGQDSQTVTRYNLSELYVQRDTLIKRIDQLAEELGITEPKQKIFQVVPSW